MKKRYPVFISLALLITLSGCKKEEGPALKDTTKRTVVAYLFGDVNLWDAMMMSINQMERGWNPETNGTLLVYLDASPHLTQFGAPVLLEIQHDESDLIVSRVVRTYPDRDAADPEVFTEVLTDATILYPADSYGLILGGHGNGWFTSPEKEHGKAIGNSERFDGPFMDIDVLATALPVHYDFIVFHACLMGEAATLYQLRNQTDYVLASVESLPGYAYPYHKVIPSLFTQPNADLSYFQEGTRNEYATEFVHEQGFNYATFAIYRMSAMEALAAQTKNALECLNSQYSTMLNYAYDLTVRDPLSQGLLSYPQADPNTLLSFDFGLLCQAVDAVDPAMGKQLRKAVGDVVIQHSAVGGRLDVTIYNERALGLSYYIPYPVDKIPAAEPFNQAFYSRFGWSAASGFTSKWE